MSELMDLYQELIIDHNRRPRNRGPLDGADHDAEGYNPLCGDRVTIHLVLKDDVIEDVRFEGGGCAISTASASIMTEAVKGKTIDEARALFERFHHLVTGEAGPGEGPPLGKLEAFGGVGKFPARVKCATLAWHTLQAAIDERKDVVSTE
ncbi:MAG: Fe-S cluster assembly sulfur transfer protein SufU [Planctomycetota bacterium]|jgi:nitrogen fixation NifU-like protein